MAAMFIKLVVFCFVGIAVTEVASDAVNVKTLDVKSDPNDYFGDIKSEVKPSDEGTSISATIPIKKDLDKNLQVKVSLTFNNIEIVKDHVIPLCDAISTTGFFKPIIDKIEPSGKFPSECPIPAGEWKVTDYVINTKDYIPIDLIPSGNFDAYIEVGLPDEKPLVTVTVKGTVERTGGLLGSVFKLF